MLAVRRAGRPPRKDAAAPAPATAGIASRGPTAWSPPERGGACVSETATQQAVSRVTAKSRPESAKLARSGKTAELCQRCASLHPTDPLGNNLERFADQPEAPPEPDDPVGESMVAQHEAAICHICEDQCAKKARSATWDQIWLAPTKNLKTSVKERRASNNKKSCVEKLDHELSPHAIVEECPNVEAEMWERGNGSNCRSALAWLRHRFCLLFSASGILRCESLCKAELSDF